jgi:hypothetical protein
MTLLEVKFLIIEIGRVKKNRKLKADLKKINYLSD